MKGGNTLPSEPRIALHSCSVSGEEWLQVSTTEMLSNVSMEPSLLTSSRPVEILISPSSELFLPEHQSSLLLPSVNTARHSLTVKVSVQFGQFFFLPENLVSQVHQGMFVAPGNLLYLENTTTLHHQPPGVELHNYTTTQLH